MWVHGRMTCFQQANPLAGPSANSRSSDAYLPTWERNKLSLNNIYGIMNREEIKKVDDEKVVYRLCFAGNLYTKYDRKIPQIILFIIYL